MPVRQLIAAALALLALVLVAVAVRQYQARRATGRALNLALLGGLVTLVAAGGLALGP